MLDLVLLEVATPLELARNLLSNGDSPKINLEDSPDKSETRPVDLDPAGSGPAGVETITKKKVVQETAQGQAATIDFEQSIETDRGPIKSRRNVSGRMSAGLCPDSMGVITGSYEIKTEGLLTIASVPSLTLSTRS